MLKDQTYKTEVENIEGVKAIDRGGLAKKRELYSWKSENGYEETRVTWKKGVMVIPDPLFKKWGRGETFRSPGKVALTNHWMLVKNKYLWKGLFQKDVF